MKNKIGWCDMTFNPVWGCLNNCEYCYARGIAKRFGSVMAVDEYYSHYWGNKRCAKGINKAEVKRMSESLREFKPTFLYGQYFKKLPKKPQRIFVGSMSEIAFWEKEWMDRVVEKTKEYPQHTFQFLTKDSYVYGNREFYYFPQNCWLGVTITKESDFKNIAHRFIYSNNNITYLSIEPILERIKPSLTNPLCLNIDWVIIGAETGNRKDKVIPKKEWVDDIVNYCRAKNIPLYLKDSLKEIYPVEIKEFPKQGDNK